MSAPAMTERPKLLSYKDLKALGITYSREHLFRLEAANRFPRRIYLSAQRIAWLQSEIEKFIADRAAERSGRIYRNHD